MKLDSDSRLNTLGSILSVPENNECEGTPKSSISDSKLSVDYFNTSPILPNSNCKENEVKYFYCHGVLLVIDSHIILTNFFLYYREILLVRILSLRYLSVKTS